jgi:predicted RNase H-like HicB family nuclease
MLNEYMKVVMQQAVYRILEEDDSIYGEIPGFEEVTARADCLEQCQQDLGEALEEWIFFRVSRHLPVPTVGGITLSHEI